MDHRSERSAAAVRLDDEDSSALEAFPGEARATLERAREVREESERLLALIEALPAKQREGFLLQQEAGTSLGEIAEVTGVGRETAKSRLRDALARWRAMDAWR